MDVNRKAKIYYIALDDFWRKEQKLEWLRENHISQIKFDRIEPDAKNNWINQTDNDWNSLMPLIDKDVKAGKSEEAIFQIFSSGLKTQRDEWIYDSSEKTLEDKIRFFIKIYESSRKKKNFPDKMKIKWDRELDKYLNRNIPKEFLKEQIQKALYRPYISDFIYFDRNFIGMNYQWNEIYRINDNSNSYIAFNALGNTQSFHSLATNKIVDLHLTGDSQCLPLYVYHEDQKHENITDWALSRFREHYKKSKGASITKEDIFYYIYAALHSPVYRQKYEQNLKREFPRIPFYEDFFQWRDWGRELADLHINYETQEPFPLERKDLPKKAKQTDLFAGDKNSAFELKPQTKLRALKDEQTILIDSITTLTGIPPQAWEYKLGNRSALEWILDQYKEKTPQDATIREKFNTYKFADYKEQTIDLLKRVTNVSIKTTEIINSMPTK